MWLRTVIRVCLILAATEVSAQFPATLHVGVSGGQTATSPVTAQDMRYRITIEGFRSCGPGGAGTDAVWDYDTSGMPSHWAGDPGHDEVGGCGGFRIDGRTLPRMEPDPFLHRYQYIQVGNGRAFTFTFSGPAVDSTIGSPVTNHSPVRGCLRITIEEVIPYQLNIGGVERKWSDASGIGMCIKANMLRFTTDGMGYASDALKDIGTVGVVCDGRFICADSITYQDAKPARMGIGLVVDNSGSMGSPIVFGKSATTRMVAAQQALVNFVSSRSTGDSMFIIRFDSTSREALDWTDSQRQLHQAIYSMRSKGNTALHQAMLDAIAKLGTGNHSAKALIVMTDGINNRPPMEDGVVLDAIRAANIPVYIIALGFTDTPDERTGLAAMNRFVRAAPAGQLLLARDADDLMQIYGTLSTNIATEPWCHVHVTLPPTAYSTQERVLQLVVPFNDALVCKRVTLECSRPLSAVHRVPLTLH